MSKLKTKNVLDLAKVLGDDKATSRDLGNHLSERRLVQKLVALRGAKGLTQEEVASRMGCTQGKVSKFESSVDDDLNFGTFLAYSRAIGFNVELLLVDGTFTLVDRIKNHANCIRTLTDRLAAIASKDLAIAKGVNDFFFEALVNLVGIVQDAAKKLPVIPSESHQSPKALVVDTCEPHEVPRKPKQADKRSKRKVAHASN